MRKRIEELAEGKVECIGQDVIFSVSRIEIETYAGEDYTGEFTVAGKIIFRCGEWYILPIPEWNA